MSAQMEKDLKEKRAKHRVYTWDFKREAVGGQRRWAQLRPLGSWVFR